MKINEIYNIIDCIAPFEKQEKWDNSGLIIGNMNENVSGIVTCMDVTDKVIKRAVDINANLIISHHPVIFSSLKQIQTNSIIGTIIKNNLNVISNHTNFDICKIGTDVCLSDKLCLSNRTNLPIVGDSKNSFGMIGLLQSPLTVTEFINNVKDIFHVDGVKATLGNRNIKKVATCAGAGGEFLPLSISMGADAFVTGEVKYFDHITAEQNGITLVELGHYNSEKYGMIKETEYLKSNISDLNIEFFEGEQSTEICV